jgi:hypothetical protein
MSSKGADPTGIIQKISTPLQLVGLIVVGILQILQIVQNAWSPLAIISVSILGFLGVMVIYVMFVSKKRENEYLIKSKKQEREYLVDSGIMRLQILIEWITEFQKDTTNRTVCRDLEIRLKELRASLNYILLMR